MSSKIGTVLSLLFFAMAFLFGVDLMMLEYSYSTLDSKAVAISYVISKAGYINDSLISSIEEKYAVEFSLGDNSSPLFGDVVDYIISQEYDPIIISKGPMTISVKRSFIMGYYN